ncbi:hypothetical protein HK097_000980 [Rhizophlyctis rosea]|uniref:Uncharacterized protein n=1 Tax=Rhizophlyctis rosea TaxID=64517 RepID=A0AAD5SHV4_9FUNG|nr:hypothetical protein HK097_000980 [Rhizophlyctis rosea]
MLASAVDVIVAENPPQAAHQCLSTLLTIAQNLSRDRQKYGILKGTNERLQKDVIQIEGGLEALVTMGFNAETDDLSNSIYYEFQSITHTPQLPKYIKILSNALMVVKDLRARSTADYESLSSGGPSGLKPRKQSRSDGFVDVKREVRMIGQERHERSEPLEEHGEEDGFASDSSSPTSSLYASSISSAPNSRAPSPVTTQPPQILTARQRLEAQRCQRLNRVESAAKELRKVAKERHGGQGMMSRMPERSGEEDEEGDRGQEGEAPEGLDRFAKTLPWWFKPLDIGVLLVVLAVVAMGLIDPDIFPGLLLMLVLYFVFMSRTRSSARVGADGSILRSSATSSTGRYRSNEMNLKQMQQREQVREIMARARYADNSPSLPNRMVQTLKSWILHPPTPIDLLKSFISYINRRYDHLFILSILLYLSIYVIYPNIQSYRHKSAAAGTAWDGSKDLIPSHGSRPVFPQPTPQQLHIYKVYYMSNPKLMEKMFMAGPMACLNSVGKKREMCEAFWWIAKDQEAWQQMWGIDKKMEEARVLGEIEAAKGWAANYNPWLEG